MCPPTEAEAVPLAGRLLHLVAVAGALLAQVQRVPMGAYHRHQINSASMTACVGTQLAVVEARLRPAAPAGVPSLAAVVVDQLRQRPAAVAPVLSTAAAAAAAAASYRAPMPPQRAVPVAVARIVTAAAVPLVEQRQVPAPQATTALQLRTQAAQAAAVVGRMLQALGRRAAQVELAAVVAVVVAHLSTASTLARAALEGAAKCACIGADHENGSHQQRHGCQHHRGQPRLYPAWNDACAECNGWHW